MAVATATEQQQKLRRTTETVVVGPEGAELTLISLSAAAYGRHEHRHHGAPESNLQQVTTAMP